MKLKPFRMGSEVEYSMSSRHPHAHLMREQYHEWMLDAIRAEHRWLPDINNPSGIYLDNGSRYYLDCGCHNELASPELTTPREIAAYDRAAEQILFRAKAAVRAQHGGMDICITKCNVNFDAPDLAAWGQHEAYTCWIPLESAARQLIPHLVSRIPYAGAGCLSSHPHGMGYELSQRSRHMTQATGLETTRERAIFCTRAWKPSDVSQTGWTRTNLISKDSQRTSFGMYLSYGVTGLMFLVINEGHRLGRKLQLENPVAAMRMISLDPWLKTSVALANGKNATALDIQREYLRELIPHVESGDYPEWTNEVLHHWSATLEQLSDNPLALADRLDAYLKLKVLDHQIRRASHSWGDIHHALGILHESHRVRAESDAGVSLDDVSRDPEGVLNRLYRRFVKPSDRQPTSLDCLQFAVRLQALELNYHELGGWFDRLASAGSYNPIVLSSQEVETAIHRPPLGGRAEARSNLISELDNQTWCCDWQYVVNNKDGKWYDLRDPFSNHIELVTSNESFPRGARSRRHIRLSI